MEKKLPPLVKTSENFYQMKIFFLLFAVCAATDLSKCFETTTLWESENPSVREFVPDIISVIENTQKKGQDPYVIVPLVLNRDLIGDFDKYTRSAILFLVEQAMEACEVPHQLKKEL
jgi:hypothetical protein